MERIFHEPFLTFQLFMVQIDSYFHIQGKVCAQHFLIAIAHFMFLVPFKFLFSPLRQSIVQMILKTGHCYSESRQSFQRFKSTRLSHAWKMLNKKKNKQRKRKKKSFDINAKAISFGHSIVKKLRLYVNYCSSQKWQEWDSAREKERIKIHPFESITMRDEEKPTVSRK